MTITSIDGIRANAEAAASAGKTRLDACPFPLLSVEARQWCECYDEFEFEAAVAQYRAAIGESSAVA